MAKQTFIVEKDKLELFISLAEKNKCQVTEHFERDNSFEYVNIHYVNVKDIFLLGFDFGSYSLIFQTN